MSDAAVYDLAAVVAERDALKAEVAKLKTENGRLTDVLLSKHGGEPLQLMDELDDARAEVAKLRAACAAKDAALRAAITFIRDRVSRGPDEHNAVAALQAALSDDAGKGWIDASGAVESHCYIYVHEKYPDGPSVVRCRVPDDWAGASVKIVRVKP